MLVSPPSLPTQKPISRRTQSPSSVVKEQDVDATSSTEQESDDSDVEELQVVKKTVLKELTDNDTPVDDLERLQAVTLAVPRREYVTSATPIEELPRLSKACAAASSKENTTQPRLFVKRDDLLPLAGGGSKTRKLDYLVQAALDAQANVVVTCGAVQSNHCRLTASAAAREGLECWLVLEERVPGSYNPSAGGNNYTFDLLGAQRVPAANGQVAAATEKLVSKLQADGKNPYVIPGGGSNALGALGYARCAAELVEQSRELVQKQQENNTAAADGGLFWDAVVVCSGSGGTHSGLLTGLRAAGITTPVVGISVRLDAKTQTKRIHDQCNAIVDQYFKTCPYFVNGKMPAEDVVVLDDFVGPGYSLPTAEMAEAVQSFARLESILLDPVYTGKGAAGFLHLARSGTFGQRLLFIHTGGAPSLYHYQTLPDDASTTISKGN